MVIPNTTESDTEETVLVSTLSSTEFESDEKEKEEQKHRRPVHSDTVAMYALSNLDMSDVSQEQTESGKFAKLLT